MSVSPRKKRSRAVQQGAGHRRVQGPQRDDDGHGPIIPPREVERCPDGKTLHGPGDGQPRVVLRIHREVVRPDRKGCIGAHAQEALLGWPSQGHLEAAALHEERPDAFPPLLPEPGPGGDLGRVPHSDGARWRRQGGPIGKAEDPTFKESG